jgi:alkane 1-monooxygenase
MVRAYLDFHVPYYINSFIVLSLIFSFESHRNQFFGLWVIYAVLPLIDMVIPNDNINPTPEESKILAKQFKWKIPLYLFILVEWYAAYFSLWICTTFELSAFQLFIHVISLGHTHAIGFLFAHELFHKKNKFDVTLGTFDMLKNLYMHFHLEHIYGHHKYVSTPEDPATARMNQSLYSFLYQTITGSFRNSLSREISKLKSRNLSFFSLSNRMLSYFLLEILIVCLVYLRFGRMGVLIFVCEAAFAIFILETINYIRHYGLMRKEISPGVYEQVSIKHSWNAPQWLHNCILLKLQRHSDHHANSYKPYQCLESLENSPTLPGGYIGLITLALISPLWFFIINPIAKEATLEKPPKSSTFSKCSTHYKIWIISQSIFFTLLLRFGETSQFKKLVN